MNDRKKKVDEGEIVTVTRLNCVGKNGDVSVYVNEASAYEFMCG